MKSALIQHFQVYVPVVNELNSSTFFSQKLINFFLPFIEIVITDSQSCNENFGFSKSHG